MNPLRKLRYWLLGIRATVRMIEHRDERIRSLAAENEVLKQMVTERDRSILRLNAWYGNEKALRQQYKKELDLNEITKAQYRAQLRQAEEARKDLAAFADKLSIPHALGPEDLEASP